MLYADGGGLYLKVTAANTRSWVFRYMINGFLGYLAERLLPRIAKPSPASFVAPMIVRD